MNRIYCGRRVRRKAGPAEVWCNGRPLDPAPSLRLYNHSPDGFQWGYGGSGPAQLALALLLDALRQPKAALHWHQEFKRQVVTSFPDEWVLTAQDIAEWYANARLDPEPEEAPNVETR